MNDLEKRLRVIEEKLGIVKETLKLKVGTWYKYPYYENWKLCITSIDGNDVGGYGVDLSGGWMRSGKWGVVEDELSKLIECTPQEVEKALIKEAKRIGLVYGVRFISPNGEDWDFKVTSNDFHFDAVNNTLSFTQHLGGTVFLFVHGNWAEVIEQTSSLEQDIQQLKDKYKQYKFTITIEDNI